jgi:uncharacterized protein YndB with AHSA1/START domain
MPGAERTIAIARPPEVVFGYLTDHANDPAWRPNVVQIEPIADAPTRTRIHQVIRGPMGRGIAADIEVTANDRPRRYGFQVVAGPVRPRGEFVLSPSAAGTDLHFALSAELSGIKRLLMSGSVQASMDAEMSGLDTVKRLIEGS